MEFTATDIASYLKGEIIGDKNVTVHSISKIEEGKKGTLAFLSNPKYENFLYDTNASIILINKNLHLKKKVNATLIKVDDAYKAFASLLDLYMQAKSKIKQGVEQPCYFDKSASLGKEIYLGAFSYIGKNVKLGDRVKIYPHVFIGDNVVVKDDTTLFPGARIYADCLIGERCIIHSGVVVGSDGFGFAPLDDGGFKKIPQIGNVIIEDDVEIGANTTIDCGTIGSTIIKQGAKIDNLVQIAHNCEIGENTVMAGQTGLAGTTKVGKNCKFAGQVGLAGHLTIGDNVQIGAQSGISKNIKSNQIVLGTPATDYKQMIRIYSIFRNLPGLRGEILQLKKEIKDLKQKS